MSFYLAIDTIRWFNALAAAGGASLMAVWTITHWGKFTSSALAVGFTALLALVCYGTWYALNHHLPVNQAAYIMPFVLGYIDLVMVYNFAKDWKDRP